MPIYDQSFRHYTGPRNVRTLWWPIALHTFRPALKQKLVWMMGIMFLLYLTSLSIFLITSLVLKNQTNANTSEQVLRELRRSGIRVFGDSTPIGTILYAATEPVFSMVWLLILIVGAGCISSDKRFNALPLYFSRPLKPYQYMLGKIAGVMFLPFCALLLTQWLLGIQYTAYFHSVGRVLREAPAFLSAAAVALLQCAFIATAMVAISSITKSGRVAGVFFMAFFILSNRLFVLLARSNENEYFLALSPRHSLNVVARSIMDVRLRDINPSVDTGALSVPLSIASLAGYMLLFVFIIRRNLKVVEVVK